MRRCIESRCLWRALEWCSDVLNAGAWNRRWEGIVRQCIESRCLGRTSLGDGAAMCFMPMLYIYNTTYLY